MGAMMPNKVARFLAHGVHSLSYNAVADNTGLFSFVYLLSSPKCAKSCKLSEKLNL